MKNIGMKKVLLNIVFIILLVSINGCIESSDSSSSTSNTTSLETTLAEVEDNDFEAVDWTEETHSKDVDPNFTEVFDDSQVKRLDIVISSEKWQSMLDEMTELYGEFGIEANNTPINGGVPPEGLLPPQDGTIPVEGPVPPENEEILESPIENELSTDVADPSFVAADIYYNSIQWYKVGVRFKGNSSLKTAWEQGILKLSLKLDFDEYEDDYPQIKNQRFYGFKKLSLKNNYDDSSFLREKVAADVFRDAGLAVSNTAFYTVYIDKGEGPEYFGLYTLVEEIDDTLIDTQFSSDDGNLYKPEDGKANFVGTFDKTSTDDTQYFEKKTNDDEDEADWSDIDELFTALHDDTRISEPETWRTNLETVFDVDSFLKYLAVNGTIQNWDTYGRMIHNYYLYNNPDNGKLTWIPWDNNEALKVGKLGGSLALDFNDLSSDAWPLIEKIYADETYKAQYDLYLQDTIDSAFNSDTMEAQYDTYSTLVEEYATSEREGFSFLNNVNDANEFTVAINELKTHATARKTAVETYLAP